MPATVEIVRRCFDAASRGDLAPAMAACSADGFRSFARGYRFGGLDAALEAARLGAV